MLVYIDFETRSTVKPSVVGVYNYAEHPTTRVTCMAFAIDDYPVEIWKANSGEDFPGKLFTHAQIVAHNVPFEKNILRACFGIDVPWDRWIDTAALARHGGLPAKLEKMAEALRLPEQKDMAGNRVMLKLAAPRKGSFIDDGEGDEGPRFWTEDLKPEDFAAMYAYCQQDVRVMRAALPRLPPMSKFERSLWLSTEATNERGVRIDLASIPAARAFAEGHAARLEARYTAITGQKMKANAAARAGEMGLLDFRKPTVRNALRRTDLTPAVREALEIRREGSKSSVAKLKALVNRTSPDGRLRGALTYCGAVRTGRFSSSGVQLQNIPRGYGPQTELAFEALHRGVLDVVFPDGIGTIAEMLRGFLVGPFTVADFAQIEARVLAWLAGEEWLLSTFRMKGDPYKLMASRIYGAPVEAIDKDQRFMGKQVILGCGYGMGAPKFKRMLDETYDMVIDEPFAYSVVNTYRSAHPKIVKLWSTLHNGMLAMLASRKTIRVGPVVMGMEGTSAFIQLPSGRRLFYPQARLSTQNGHSEIEFWGMRRDQQGGGGWGLVNTYGGKMVENITQALARDVMAVAMIKLELSGIPVLFTVHDEIVVDAGVDISRFKDILTRVPGWAPGLPIEADVFTTNRYRK
jgi:DNA polymerase